MPGVCLSVLSLPIHMPGVCLSVLSLPIHMPGVCLSVLSLPIQYTSTSPDLLHSSPSRIPNPSAQNTGLLWGPREGLWGHGSKGPRLQGRDCGATGPRVQGYKGGTVGPRVQGYLGLTNARCINARWGWHRGSGRFLVHRPPRRPLFLKKRFRD